MIFTLKSYSDLGRCSYGTLMDEFDTDNNTIFSNGTEVKINSIEDLFPYLWETAGISVHDGKKRISYFSGPGTHWHHDFDESIKRYEKHIVQMRKKIAKDPDNRLAGKWKNTLEWEEKHVANLKEMLSRYDEMMEGQKKLLIEENR